MEQSSALTPKRVQELLQLYGKDDGIEKTRVEEFYQKFKHKRYCVFVFLENPVSVRPFRIDKTGFGALSARITVKDILKITK